MADRWVASFLTRGISGFRKNRYQRVWVTEEAIYFADLGEKPDYSGTALWALAGLVPAIVKGVLTHEQRARFDEARGQAEAIAPEDLVLDGKDTFRAAREDFEWSGLRLGSGRIYEWMVQLREQGSIRFYFATQADWDEAKPALRAWFTADFDGGVTWDDEQKKFVPSAL